MRSWQCAEASVVNTAAVCLSLVGACLVRLTCHVEASRRCGPCRQPCDAEWRATCLALLLCVSLSIGTPSCSRNDRSTEPSGPDTLCACVDEDTLYYPPLEGFVECQDSHASWSPGGDFIAYTDGDHGPSQIWLIEPDGSNPRYLVNGSLPDWSPDGTRIALMRGFNIYVLTLADSSLQQLTDDGGSAFPDWSPSGNGIAYDTTRGRIGIWIMDPDGSGKRWVCEGWTPDWSPDGSKLAFVGPGVGEAVNDIWIVDVEGTNARSLTRGAWHSNVEPSWSPDGKSVAWTAHSFTSGGPAIWVIRSDGTGACRMISAATSEANWSPDGTAIVHTRRLPGSIPWSYCLTIWVFETRDCSKRQITFPP
jgi:hypothetical protein